MPAPSSLPRCSATRGRRRRPPMVSRADCWGRPCLEGRAWHKSRTTASGSRAMARQRVARRVCTEQCRSLQLGFTCLDLPPPLPPQGSSTLRAPCMHPPSLSVRRGSPRVQAAAVLPGHARRQPRRSQRCCPCLRCKRASTSLPAPLGALSCRCRLLHDVPGPGGAAQVGGQQQAQGCGHSEAMWTAHPASLRRVRPDGSRQVPFGR